MNAAWASVTGPFYIPGPEEQPNVFASFMANFLGTKTPWAMKLWEQRLQALDPYARYAALAELAKIQLGYDEAAAANWRTLQQTDAMNRGALSDILGMLGRYETARMEANVSAGVENTRADVERMKQMTVSSREGLEAVRQARVALNGAVQEFSQGDPQYGDRFALNLRAVQQALAAIPNAAERTAAEQQIARELADGRELFGGSPQGLAAADWIEAATRAHFGEPRLQAGVRDVGGAGPLDVDRVYGQANSLLGLPGAMPTPRVAVPAPPSAPAPSSVPSSPALDTPFSTLSAGSLGEAAPFSAGVTTRRSATLPGAGGGAPDALGLARQELDRDPQAALGGFGQPVPLQEAYLRAYIAAHPEKSGARAPATPPARPVPMPAPVAPAPAAGSTGGVRADAGLARQVPAATVARPPRAMGYPGTAERMEPDPLSAISFADVTRQIRRGPVEMPAQASVGRPAPRAAAPQAPAPRPAASAGSGDRRVVEAAAREQQARAVLERLRQAETAGQYDEADRLRQQLDDLMVY